MRTLQRGLLALLLAASSTACGSERPPCADERGAIGVIAPGQEGQVRDLVEAGPEAGHPVGNITLEHSRIVLEVQGGELIVRDHLCRPGEAGNSASFTFERRGEGAALAAIEAIEARVRERDRGGFWRERVLPEGAREGEPMEGDPDPWRAIQAVLVLLVSVALVLLVTRGLLRSSDFVQGHLKATHLLPGLLQVVLLSYLALYWRDLGPMLPWIGAELVWAYLLDLGLALWRFRSWRLSFAPLPVTLSTNLFIQFPEDLLFMQFGAITVAILSKHLIRWRTEHGERHVFNPSSLGLGVIGALTLLVPAVDGGDIANEFNLPPNMAELILIIAVAAQLRVPVVLISLSAFAGLAATNPLFWPIWESLGRSTPAPEWAPVLLVLALLLTDPVTTPRRPLAQVLFGLLCGLAIGATSLALTLGGFNDFYSKVIPVPVVTLLVPTLDRLAGAIEARLPDHLPTALTQAIPASLAGLVPTPRSLLRVLEPRFNRAHVLLWIGLVATMIALHKPDRFDGPLQHHNRTRFLSSQADPQQHTCETDPLFCEAFSFPSELSYWTQSLGAPPATPLSPPRAPGRP